MNKIYVNPNISQRFDELITEGERQLQEQSQNNWEIRDPTALTIWTTSCFNLLDKLSHSTNRFVQEFEFYGRVGGATRVFNLGLALGVLKAAREEYVRGLAIDYHLSVSASVFGSI